LKLRRLGIEATENEVFTCAMATARFLASQKPGGTAYVIGEVVMVGDTMETDILGAVQMGYRSVLVLSGGTRRQDLKKFAYQPDLIVDHVGLIPDEFIFENLPACL
jgi:ribonucleotide monophosphatase NagD (HAD superfamily)